MHCNVLILYECMYWGKLIYYNSQAYYTRVGGKF